MSTIKVTSSLTIRASAVEVYTILADYKEGHPKILPAEYFSNYVVERGGNGAGTRIRLKALVFGQSREVHAEVREPEPGRVLEETDLNSGLVTTFTVEPEDHGKAATVTIETKWNKQGVGGFIEGLIAPYLLRPVYTRELQNLARLVENEE